MTLGNKRRYYCKDCGVHKWVRGRDENLDRIIQTGCEECGYIVPFKKVGVL